MLWTQLLFVPFRFLHLYGKTKWAPRTSMLTIILHILEEYCDPNTNNTVNEKKKCTKSHSHCSDLNTNWCSFSSFTKDNFTMDWYNMKVLEITKMEQKNKFVAFPKYWENIVGLEMLTYSCNFWLASQININTTISSLAAFHQVFFTGDIGRTLKLESDNKMYRSKIIIWDFLWFKHF